MDRNTADFSADSRISRRSLAGAWIETATNLRLLPWRRSRSLAGAWIETSEQRHARIGAACRSLAGAWIETKQAADHAALNPVAPSRERGSKPPATTPWIFARLVAPSRERGSKQGQGAVDPDGRRRSLAGAWIETRSPETISASARVAPSRERGSKLRSTSCCAHLDKSLPRGSVDRNVYDIDGRHGWAESLPRGSVDRNKTRWRRLSPTTVSLPRGSVDRNCCAHARTGPSQRSLPRGSVDRNRRIAGDAPLLTVAPSRERGSKHVTGQSSGLKRLAGRSLAGAWIETRSFPTSRRCRCVAPSRERGSKRLQWSRSSSKSGVAPSRERGSKRLQWSRSSSKSGVAPSRERGSKHLMRRFIVVLLASLPRGSVDRNVDQRAIPRHRAHVAPSRERGSKPGRAADLAFQPGVAPSRERGSKQPTDGESAVLQLSLPRGSVDRNAWCLTARTSLFSRSLAGAWIETLSGGGGGADGRVAPSRERGSKRWIPLREATRFVSLPRGSVDRNPIPAWKACRPRPGRSLAGAWIETAD